MVPPSCKILIVDDEPLLKSLINQKFKNKIKSKEFEFFFSQNGQEALDLLQKTPGISIVLLDINMPVMDGFTLLDTLLKQERAYRIIIVTAYADMTNVRRAISKGASDFITKPIDLDDLEKTLSTTISLIKSQASFKMREKALKVLSDEFEKGAVFWQTPKKNEARSDIMGDVFPQNIMPRAFFEIRPQDERRIYFSLGDVEGKGVHSGLFLTALNALFGSALTKKESPKSIFDKLQKLISSKNPLTVSARVFLGVFDAKTGSISFVDAGGLLGLVLKPDGSVNEVKMNSGPVLIDSEDVKLEELKLRVDAGDILFLGSKKMTKLQNRLKEEYGTSRLKEILSKNAGSGLEPTLQGLKNDLALFLEGVAEIDQVAFLLLKGA